MGRDYTNKYYNIKILMVYQKQKKKFLFKQLTWSIEKGSFLGEQVVSLQANQRESPNSWEE